MQLGARRGAPVVDLGAAGEPQFAVRRRRSSAWPSAVSAGAERHRLEPARRRRRRRSARTWSLPTTSALTSRTGPAATRGAGQPMPIGPAAVHRLDQRGVTPARRENASSSSALVGRRHGDRGGQPLLEERGERVDAARRRSSAPPPWHGRRRRPAARCPSPPAPPRRDRRRRSSGPTLADARHRVERDDDRRAAESLPSAGRRRCRSRRGASRGPATTATARLPCAARCCLGLVLHRRPRSRGAPR